ncbi:PREDICTED: fragile X mental retardation 1 neighbor protein [Colobus angolensis palliatus]|uniref:FMR1 neighbor n=1 Tax=Colobus angolensis palliatus TaxID=336983 RepID=A0A2K5KAR9_COLAP|nr:PREDICTED: fragile X mental retardation 1 neighbor protein [Colobus angolensis palliatus]
MPSDRRQVKRRNRSIRRALRVAHLELATYGVAVTVSDPESSRPGSEATIADRPQPGWLESLKMWVSKPCGTLMLSIWILLLVCYYLCSGPPYFVFPSGYILQNSENTSGQSLEEDYASEALLNFFFPTTCILSENQVVKPCNELEDLNESECLSYKCCFSSLESMSFKCFAPLRDEPKQMMRMFGLGAISLIILGYLPIYCCSLFWRSKWANYLRRKVSRVITGLKKQRRKVKKSKMLQRAARGDEGHGEE